MKSRRAIERAEADERERAAEEVLRRLAAVPDGRLLEVLRPGRLLGDVPTGDLDLTSELLHRAIGTPTTGPVAERRADALLSPTWKRLADLRRRQR